MSVFGDEIAPEYILLAAFVSSVTLLGCYQMLLKAFLGKNSNNVEIQHEVSIQVLTNKIHFLFYHVMNSHGKYILCGRHYP